MILKLMIMCCLYTPELKLTTCSLCSIHDPYSTLETPVVTVLSIFTMAQRILAKHIRIISDYISAMNIEPIWLQNLEQIFFFL